METQPTLTLSGKSYPLNFTLASLYRLQGLPKPPDLSRTESSRVLRTIIDTVWAALPAGAGFETPEALAEAVGSGTQAIEIITTAYNALNEAMRETPEKKTEPPSSPTPPAS